MIQCTVPMFLAELYGFESLQRLTKPQGTVRKKARSSLSIPSKIAERKEFADRQFAMD